MFRSPFRRLAVVAIAALAIDAGLASMTTITAAEPTPVAHHTLYRNFCPLTSADVAAAGPYRPSSQP
jgi:hypothetical protein